MQTKWKKIFSFALAAVVAVSAVPTTEMRVQAQEEENLADLEYEIYPIPREISYDQDSGTMELSDAPNLIIEESVDEATENRLNEILEMKGIEGTESGAVVSGKTNILVGVKGSEGAVDAWFAQNVAYPENHFDEVDSYVLAIQDNVIAVLGKDTDAAFYGLSTLKLIVEQTKGRTIRKLQVNDYASGQYRGFIEGYYGIPWSVEDRISLMEFGGDFKMNIYIFAPKDDPYHNSQWREAYPPEQLADIKRMVEAGAASKCRFAWAIHPFMNDPITLADYDEGLAAIQTKFEGLYEAGVRQFVISADDANSPVTLQARLCKDMTDWVKAHEGCYNLVFVPQVYCTSALTWSNWGWSGTPTVEQYFGHFSDIEDLEIMWTGEWVCHPASQNTITNFKNKSGKEAFMWLNWPVNDVNHARLVMGPAETGILEPGLHDFMGLVTNPLEQAEASKTALFATADFAWNTTDFSCFESWADGFKYIEPGAPEAMHELCKHLTNPSPGGITSMGESTELTPYITAFTNAYDGGNGTDYEDEANALMEQFQKIVKAADDFQNNGINANLQDEMKPWVDSLRYLSRACIGFIKTAIELKNEDREAVFGSYLSAVNNYKASQQCEAPQLAGTVNAEAGAMKIMPFAATMNSAVEERALEILGGDLGGESTSSERTLIYSGLGGIHQGEIENATDGDDTTFVWFNNAVDANSYIGLDLGDTYILDQIRILQGGHNTAVGDIFSSGILEYSLDKRTWTSIGEYSGSEIEENVLDQSIQARYVRLRTPSATNKWYAIREFSVIAQPLPTFVYTNAEAYEEIPTVIETTRASISEIEEDIVLASGEYIGLEFPFARELTSLTADYTNADKLTLEYSYNGFEWIVAEDPFETADARYVRIINKGEDSVTFHLTELSTGNETGNKTVLAEPEGERGHEGERAVDDSLLTSFAAVKGEGSLTWRMESKLADKLYIIQDAENISNAKVQIRTNTKQWIDLGTLDACQNIFEIFAYGSVNEVKISWKENGPTIYEIYTENDNKEEYSNVKTLTETLKYAEKQENDGYTEDSFAEFQAALAAAKQELNKPGITEADAAKVLAAFYQAASKLERVESPNPNPGPGENPNPNPGPGGNLNPDPGPGGGKDLNLLKVGDVTIEKDLKYRVTDAGAKEAAVCGVADAKKKNKMNKITIPETVTVKGVVCKVTGIDNKAFSAMKKLKTVIIGGNIKSIGSKAFFNNKKLKKITIKSLVLTKVAKNAFKKSSGSGTIKVPKSKKKAYVKLLKKCTKMKVK